MSDIGFTTGVIKTPVFSRQKESQIMAIFFLPETVRESITIRELEKIHGEFLINITYLFPVGSIIDWEGYEWEIIRYRFAPTRYRSHNQKTLAIMQTKYLRPFTPSDDDWGLYGVE